MKRLLVFVVATFIVTFQGIAQASPDSAYETAWQSWVASFEKYQAERSAPASDLEQTFSRLEFAWEALSPEEKQKLAPRRWGAYRNFAEIVLGQGQVSPAGDYLRKEVDFDREYNLLVTGRNPAYFENLVLLQGRIAVQSGIDPLYGKTLPYEFGNTEHGYYAIRKEGGPHERQTDFKSVELPDLKNDETVGYFVELLRDEQGVSLGDRYVLALEQGNDGKSLRDRIRGVYGLGGFGPSGYGRSERLEPDGLVKSLKNSSVAERNPGASSEGTTNQSISPTSTSNRARPLDSPRVPTFLSVGWWIVVGVFLLSAIIATLIWRRRV